MRRSFSLLVLLLGLFAAPFARAQFEAPAHLRPSLVADTRTIQAGRPFTVGVRLVMDPGWHTYWEYPGQYGLPVKVQWQLPPGFTAGPLRQPLPTPHPGFDGTSRDYVYEHEVLLLAEITPPATLPPGELKLAASISWQVCAETCIPGQGTVALTLPGGAATPNEPDLFARWRAQMPQPSAPFPVQWKTASPQELLLTVPSPPPGQLDFYPLPPSGTKVEAIKVSRAASGAGQEIRVTLPAGASAAAGSWRGVLVVESGAGQRQGFLVEAGASPAVGASAPATAAQRVAPGLAGILALAFLGGLILNVMPCVLPVIALKIFGFVRQAGDHPRRVFRLGLAFVAGVFAFFLVLAITALSLKTAWGFQFQNPYLLAGLIALTFVFGLNLLGVFEISLASGAAGELNELSGREGYGGAFLHGLFTTLLGTSCTAPVMATSLGYALTQPAPVVVLIFLTMAAGMSLPYFLLTANPGWMKLLPRPGLWMERFKQVTGFIMLAVAVWMLGIFSHRGAEAVAALGWYLLLLGVVCWYLGWARQRWLATGLALLAAAGGYFFLLHGRLEARPATSGLHLATPGGTPWAPFSEEALARARAEGQPVFIDFGAEWCVNCAFYEKTVLAKETVQKAFAEKKVLTLYADFTNSDPLVQKWLNSFQRNGVPLYVLYRPGEAKPIVLDALSPQTLLGHLAGLK